VAENRSETALRGTFPKELGREAAGALGAAVEVVFLKDWNCARRGDRRMVTPDCAVVWEDLGIARAVDRPRMDRMVRAAAVSK
jgi:hypothetical protein